MGDPAVTVIVPTLGERPSLASTLTALLAQEYASFAVLVVLQGDASPALPADTRLNLLRCPARRGKSAALNDGIAASEGPLLAFIDDDVVVEPGWLDRGVRDFEHDRRLGVLFGRIAAVSHRPEDALVPCFDRPAPFRRTGFAARARLNGIGGNMFARRALFEAIGPFDEALGAGARFPSGEDLDIASRAARAGWAVAYDPAAAATHLGARPHAGGESARLLRSYSTGLGALAAKDLRLGDPAVFGHLLRETGWDAYCAVARLGGRAPAPWTPRTPALLRGFAAALRTPLDRRRALFRAPARAAGAGASLPLSD